MRAGPEPLGPTIPPKSSRPDVASRVSSGGSGRPNRGGASTTIASMRRSGWPDSNWRPQRPERCALPGCATPRPRELPRRIERAAKSKYIGWHPFHETERVFYHCPVADGRENTELRICTLCQAEKPLHEF